MESVTDISFRFEQFSKVLNNKSQISLNLFQKQVLISSQQNDDIQKQFVCTMNRTHLCHKKWKVSIGKHEDTFDSSRVKTFVG
jgi:hypothetical protein